MGLSKSIAAACEFVSSGTTAERAAFSLPIYTIENRKLPGITLIMTILKKR